jgi:hypothetical protein
VLENGVKVRLLPYKKTSNCLLPTNYVAGSTEHALKNELQKDNAHCAKVHLTTIVYEMLNIPYKQVKLDSRAWALITDATLDTKQSVTLNTDFEFMKAIGFLYNPATRESTFYAGNANYEYLDNLSLDKIQDKYNAVIAAAKKSNDLNSKNNLFQAANYQSSAFLLELNKVFAGISFSVNKPINEPEILEEKSAGDLKNYSSTDNLPDAEVKQETRVEVEIEVENSDALLIQTDDEDEESILEI